MKIFQQIRHTLRSVNLPLDAYQYFIIFKFLYVAIETLVLITIYYSIFVLLKRSFVKQSVDLLIYCDNCRIIEGFRLLIII